MHWETGSEENNSHFEVERSLDAQHFSIISQMKSKGTVSGNSYYTYLDRVEFSGTRYYRLKQVDLDGTSTYSPVVPVTNQWFAPLFQAYPNPVTDYLQLKLPADKVIASMKLFDLQGRQIRQQSINAANYAVDVRNLTAGKYILQVVQGKQKWTFPFFKY